MGGGCLSDSVGYLLDSHVLLWWWFDPDRLSGPVQSLSLKHHQGKLPELAQAIGDLPGLLQADGFQPLSIALAPLIACSPPRPNWSDWCCSQPISSSPPSLAAPSGDCLGKRSWSTSLASRRCAGQASGSLTPLPGRPASAASGPAAICHGLSRPAPGRAPSGGDAPPAARRG